jgi:hypothetical protein
MLDTFRNPEISEGRNARHSLKGIDRGEYSQPRLVGATTGRACAQALTGNGVQPPGRVGS